MTARFVEVPLVPCEPWCTDGEGHPTDHPADRMCRTELEPIQLTQHDPVAVTDGTWVLDWIDVYLRRRPESGVPEVCISWEREVGVEINLTYMEAAQLRDMLTTAMEKIANS